MSKKRVHEIAKELKAHGIELDNKDVVTELLALGYDVKSHSSSLEDDQATAAVQRIVDKKKPRAAVAPVAAKGFVVRRRPGGPGPGAGSVSEVLHPPRETQYAPPSAPPFDAGPPAAQPPFTTPDGSESSAASSLELDRSLELPTAAAGSADRVEANPAPQTPTVETEPVLASSPTAVTPPEPARSDAPPVTVTVSQPEPPEVPQVQELSTVSPAASAPVPAEKPPVAAAVAPPPAAPAPPSASPTSPPVAAPQIRREVSPGQGRPYDRNQGRPPYQGRPGQGPGGRPMSGRPPYGRPAAASATGPQRPVTPSGPRPPPGPIQAPPGTDPRTLRPTATQAVVISRPAVQVRRVTPSSTAHKTIPLAPGRKAIGAVREFKVVPDHLGRGRELVDVSKNKSDRGKKRTSTAREGGGVSQQDIRELVFGRVSIPIRGKKKKPTKKGAKTLITEMAEEKKVIRVQEGITVSDLSQRMGVKTAVIIKKLMTAGTMATANQMLDPDAAGVIATDFGWRVEKVGFEVEDHLPEVRSNPEDERPRPPVVTVMGHVDHGKTSLLDSIRSANVAAGEAGGITQHIGAYTVKTEKGDLTFLDTPGHEAFTSMRARGATVTDIVVLVVAADDGVMPQTKEAVSHARAAEVPIVVAVNKIDLPGANPDRVKKDLADLNLLAEDWGGDTIMVPVSAKTKVGLDLLLENIALQAEVLELTSNPSRPAVGAIIEAKLDKGRGPVATILVQEGTLRAGDAIVTGTSYGRVRAMVNDRGESVKEVLPGYCAEVIGLSEVPTAGDTLNVVADEKAAKEIAEHRTMKERQAELGKTSKESLESLFNRMKTGEAKELKVVLKADVQGSLEAVSQAIEKLTTHKVKVSLVHRGVGALTESDVMLAAASKGIVVGFNVRAESGTEATAKAQGVATFTYGIIYELLDGVRSAMEGLLEPIRTERRLGRAEVRNLFNVPKLGTIAGAAVIDGTIKRSALVRLMRDNKQVYAGKMASLKRFKDDVREVAQGFECGIGIENYTDFKPGDIIEAYEIEETRPSLN